MNPITLVQSVVPNLQLKQRDRHNETNSRKAHSPSPGFLVVRHAQGGGSLQKSCEWLWALPDGEEVELPRQRGFTDPLVHLRGNRVRFSPRFLETQCSGGRQRQFLLVVGQTVHGFGPINDYSWTTSVFINPERRDQIRHASQLVSACGLSSASNDGAPAT